MIDEVAAELTAGLVVKLVAEMVAELSKPAKSDEDVLYADVGTVTFTVVYIGGATLAVSFTGSFRVLRDCLPCGAASAMAAPNKLSPSVLGCIVATHFR